MELSAILTEIVGSLPSGVMVVGGEPPHRVLYQNSAFLEIHGLEATEERTLEGLEVGYTLGDLDGAPLLLETLPLRTCVRTGEPQPWRELSLLTGSGDLKYIAAHARHLPGVEDEHGVFLLTVEDRTAAITASRTITSNERLFRSIFERIPIGVLIADPRGRVITMNESFGRLVRMDEETAGDLRAHHVTSPEILPCTTLIPAADMLVERHPFRQEVETGDGDSWVAVNGFPVLDEEGEVLRLLLLAVDVSNRRRNERRIRQVESMEATTRLAGGLAHDINNTITSVAGYAELLLASETDPKRLRYLSQIASGASQVTTLIETLAQLRGPDETSETTVDACELARREGERLHRQLDNKFQVQVDTQPENTAVRCSATALEDAIARLTRNAVEAMPGGGEIHLSVSPVEPTSGLRERFPGLTAGTCAAIVVGDSGIGIPQEQLHRVFEPYVTSKGPGTRKGTGLGLAIVYTFIQECGGAIEIESSEGTGTRVTMYLPTAYEL